MNFILMVKYRLWFSFSIYKSIIFYAYVSGHLKISFSQVYEF